MVDGGSGARRPAALFYADRRGEAWATEAPWLCQAHLRRSGVTGIVTVKITADGGARCPLRFVADGVDGAGRQ
jgi:hypothetical protein